MNHNSPEIYQSPTLLLLICFMGGMAFVISSYLWFWNVIRDVDFEYDFPIYIWRRQLLSFVFVMSISIFVGIYDFYNSDRTTNIWGEVLILLGFVAYIGAKNKGSISLMLYDVRGLILFGIVCILGWVVTLGIGFLLGGGLYFLFYTGNNALSYDLGFVPVLVVGLLWNVPLLLLFFKVKNNPKLCDRLGGLGGHKFLWPVMLAYLMLLTPLMIQDVANSQKWKDVKNAKIIRKA